MATGTQSFQKAQMRAKVAEAKNKILPSIAPKGFFIATRLCHILAYILKELEKDKKANVECFFCDTCHFLFIVLFIHFKDSNSSSKSHH